MWQQWVNFLAGIWLIISSFMNMSEQGMQNNLIITGIIVAVLGAWGALSYSTRMGQMTR